MRIVGGTFSGRKIEPPVNDATRPMMDRVREALFNILAHRDWGKDIGELFEAGTCVLDAFCGTGAVAYEALSWGAGHAVLFDQDAAALKTARQNALTLGIADKCQIFAADALSPPQNNQQKCGLVFLDPPYHKNLIPPAFTALDQAGWIKPHALIIAKTAKKEKLETLSGCELVLHRSYADSVLHFFQR
jgi:16S rRNA (guanine966-N2)-methyltransferase